MINKYEWLNKSKSRFYEITIIEKKPNEIMMNYIWGSCISNRGGTKNILVQTKDEARHHIHQMMKRRKYRGYDLIS